MKHLVGRIQVTNYFYFTDAELDPEGSSHNKPLYITVKYKDYMFAKVLVNNGSAINLLPRHVLDKMPINISYIRLSTTTAKAYQG